MKEQSYTVKNAVLRIKLFLAKNTAALVGGFLCITSGRFQEILEFQKYSSDVPDPGW
jgi:hypothetical protein